MIEYINATDFTDCQRLFHGRGHAYENLSHINVDWLSPVILITLYQPVDDVWLMAQANALKALISTSCSVQVQRRYEKLSPTNVLLGEEIQQTKVSENGLFFNIELGKSQNTGLFLDMKNGRNWVKTHVKDKKVLNLFAYTCAFSVMAVAGGATKVVNLDLSKSSLSKGRDNHRLNSQLNKVINHEGKRVSNKSVIFEGLDIFKSNSRIKKHGKYDLLICDPPSFQKGSVDIEKDYAKIIRKIPQWMNDNAKIMLCLNSPDLDEHFLLSEVARECPQCTFDKRIDNPSVFNEAHEGKGLKVLLFNYEHRLNKAQAL